MEYDPDKIPQHYYKSINEARELLTGLRDVKILAAPQLRAIENNDKTHKPATKPANLPVTQHTNLECLYNRRIRLPAAAAAMVRLVNRLSNKTCTQLS